MLLQYLITIVIQFVIYHKKKSEVIADTVKVISRYIPIPETFW